MPRLLPLFTWLAFPAYVWQGLGVRRRTSRMLPGRRSGAAPDRRRRTGVVVVRAWQFLCRLGRHRPYRKRARRPAFALISTRTGRAVRWRAAGFSSATSGQIRDHVLPNLSADPWTHIVLASAPTTPRISTACRASRRNSAACSTRSAPNGRRRAWSGRRCIEFTRVPALPPLLGKILEIRAGAINELGERLCFERGAVPATRLADPRSRPAFPRDGFHASEAGYRAWAEHMLGFVHARKADATARG